MVAGRRHKARSGTVPEVPIVPVSRRSVSWVARVESRARLVQPKLRSLCLEEFANRGNLPLRFDL